VREEAVKVTNIERGLKILDVCTGTGKQAFAFAKNGCDVIGIDLSEDMLKVANKKNRYDNVRFEVADATHIPYEDNYFDVSCVSFGLHDMPPAIREKVVGEMVRVTKRKGIITIVDYALPTNRVCRYLAYRFVKFYESKYYPGFIKSDLKAALKKYKIAVEKETSIISGCGRILKGINEK